MARYEVIIAEVSTGIIRCPDAPKIRHIGGSHGELSRFFQTKEDAEKFKDDIFREYADLEVTIRPEDRKVDGKRFYMKEAVVVSESFRT
jgi:hypothetical protein